MSRTAGIPDCMKRPPIVTISKLVKKCDTERPVEERDISRVSIDYGEGKNYRILERIGFGRFSYVYDAINIEKNEECVVKRFRISTEEDVKRELKSLEILRPGPNIINAKDVIKIDVPGKNYAIGIVFEKVHNTDFRFLYPLLEDRHIRYYLYQLLRAIEYTHSQDHYVQGIMHRDMKPTNIVIDHPRKILRLIDWGRSTFYVPGQAYSEHVCTLYYRAPEVLIGYRHYDYAVDMWSFGCIAAGMILRKDVLFMGTNDAAQLQCIAKVLGKRKLDAFIKKYRLRYTLDAVITDDYTGVPLRNFARPENQDTLTCSGIDLLKKILVYDHQKRLTAHEAKKHSYFQLIKQEPAQPSGEEQRARLDMGREGGAGTDEKDDAIPWDTTINDLPEIEPAFADALFRSINREDNEQIANEKKRFKLDTGTTQQQELGLQGGATQQQEPELQSGATQQQESELHSGAAQQQELDLHSGSTELWGLDLHSGVIQYQEVELPSTSTQQQEVECQSGEQPSERNSPKVSTPTGDLFCEEEDDTYDYMESPDGEADEEECNNNLPQDYDFNTAPNDCDEDERSRSNQSSKSSDPEGADNQAEKAD